MLKFLINLPVILKAVWLARFRYVDKVCGHPLGPSYLYKDDCIRVWFQDCRLQICTPDHIVMYAYTDVPSILSYKKDTTNGVSWQWYLLRYAW